MEKSYAGTIEERGNKQKNAKFEKLKQKDLSFFSHKIALRKPKHKCLVTMFTNTCKDLNLDSGFCILQSLKMVCTFLDDFL